MISFMQMAAAMSESSQVKGAEDFVTEENQAPEQDTPSDTSLKVQQEVSTPPSGDDTQQDVSLENSYRESSVDPDQDVLIALANSEKICITEHINESDHDLSISSEADKTFEISEEQENHKSNHENGNISSNENQNCESETSEIIYSENLLSDSEIIEENNFEEEKINNTNLAHTVDGIFITQNEIQNEENILLLAKESAVDEIISKSVASQEVSKETDFVTETMPEKRDEEVVSPSLQKANLRFRWAKTLPVTSIEVVFFSSYKREDPVKLTWSDTGDCYFSADMEMPTGIYKGTLVIDEKTYPVEDVTVKHYTFEADLYIKEDVIEDNFNKGRQSKPTDVDTSESNDKTGDNQKGLHYSGKIEDVIRHQMYSVDNDTEYTSKSGLGSGRHTPIGDVGVETYQDGFNNSFTKNLNASVVEDEMEQSFSRSQHSSKPNTPQPTVEEIIENTLRESRNQSPQSDILADIFSSEGRKTPVEKQSNGYKVPDQTEIQSTSASQSYHSSARQTPQRDYVDDILGSEQPKSADGSVHSYDNYKSPVRSTENSLHGSSRHTPLDDLLGQTASPRGSQLGSARQTPQQMSPAHRTGLSESLRSSQEKLYSSHGSLPGHGGSRPQSLTSEQELTQYFEQSSKKGSEHGSSSSSKNPSSQQLTITSNSNSRSHSMSLPVITTQQRLQAEKRSMTPENYVRIPGQTASPSGRPSSAARILTPTSHASSRTITPTNALDNATEKRMDDLEDTVRNLRKLLSAREQEVHELTDQLNDIKDINRTLQDDLQLSRERQAGTPKSGNYQELERRYTLLSNEKEILAQEVVKLQECIDTQNKELEERDSHPRLSSYDPNNPNALQRKIADLQSHVQDLQEANESAVAELHAAERKINDLMKQNDGLQTAQNVSQQDLQTENRRLHDKIAKLWDEGYGDSDHKLRVENQQLKDDNRAIRERNYKLHEENIKLKEELSDIRRVLERQTTDSKIYKINTSSLERDQYSSERAKLPSVSNEKPVKASLSLLNGHGDYKLSTEKDGHRYSYRQNRDEKVYSGLSDRDSLNTSQLSDSRYVTGTEKSEHKFKGSHGTDDISYKSLYDQDLSKSRDIDGKEGSRFRSLERAEAKLSSNLEKNSYLDKLSRYDTKSSNIDRLSKYDTKISDTLKRDRSLDRSYESQTPERPRPESYRSMPDGISDKDELSPSCRYDSTPERLRGSKLGHEFEKKTDYGFESRSLASMDRDYKTLTASYPELTKMSPTVSSSERTREISKSEVDLRSKRSQSRTPEHHCSCPNRSHSPDHGLPPKTGFRFRNITKRRMPHQVYSWDGLKRTEGYIRDQNNMYTTSRHRIGRSSYPTQDYYDRNYDNYNYDKKYTSYQSDGNDSDTATDILVSAQPYEQKTSPALSPLESPDHNIHSKYHRRSYSQRRDSLGSDGSSIEDMEETYNRQRLHNRSKSADGRELLRRTEPMGSSGRSDRFGLQTGDPGFRTVTPNILPTQHNRTVTTGSLTNITSGMRPFAPRTPGDINIEDVVKFSRQGGKLSQGKIKFVGHLPGRSDVYLGVELDKEDGKHDGTFEGIRYYKCKPNKGVFVAFNKIVMAWAPNL